MYDKRFDRIKYQLYRRATNDGLLRFHVTGNYMEELGQLDSVTAKELYISGLTQKSLEYFVKHHAYKFLVISFTHCNSINAFSCLECLENLEYVIIDWNTKIDRLWNMKNNHRLRGICLEDCKKVVSFDEIKDAPYLEELILQESVNSMCGSNKWYVNDLTGFASSKNIKRLGLLISGVKEYGIKPLLNMAQLEVLHINCNLFSLEEFAELNAVLKHTDITPNKPFYLGATENELALVVGGHRMVKNNSPKLLEYQRIWDLIISKQQQLTTDNKQQTD